MSSSTSLIEVYYTEALRRIPMARLVAVSGPWRGTVRQLVDGQIFIGREDSNGFCLIDPKVSRRHCAIRQVDQRYELSDLESHNGTFLNGIPVKHQVLLHGDTIRVGSSELVFLEHEDEGDDTFGLNLSDESTLLDVGATRLDQPAPAWTSGAEAGRMARDLEALLRISNGLHSIRDPALLQRELLRLIFEVIPADHGAIVLVTDLDDEPHSICNWSRKAGDHEPLRIHRELVHRALWERSVICANAASSSGEAQNIVCVPLESVDKMLGVLYLMSLGTALGEDQTHFLISISRIAAITLENRLALDALSSENQSLKEQIHTSELVGETPQIGQVKEFIARVARGDSTVLIRGESGTGKELVARAIHRQSPRGERPFVAINCAAIPESLLESELFGHEKGAFTGAAVTRKGKLEVVEDGTLFLDEIGEMAPLLQAKLLRVLQQREFERVGGNRCLTFAARVLAATNRNLETAIKSGEFRQDLYYRLNVVSITVPPLREHRQDIPLLALHFAAKYAVKSKRPFKGISRDARKLLMNYSWPGNVRELENAIEHAIVLGLTEEILPEDLPTALLEEQSTAIAGARYHTVVNQTKRELILSALQESGGNYPQAARSLGIHQKYLHRLARNLNIKGDSADDGEE
jgi:transcriptional regulator with GAF, ATPase, and Fis domain